MHVNCDFKWVVSRARFAFESTAAADAMFKSQNRCGVCEQRDKARPRVIAQQNQQRLEFALQLLFADPRPAFRREINQMTGAEGDISSSHCCVLVA
jgi:hypothetical protein